MKKGLFPSLLLSIILRFPSLFDPYWYVDEGVYLTGGQLIRKGLTLYNDLYDNKPPLIHFAAALTPSQFWFRVLGILLSLISVYLFYRLSKLLLKGFLTTALSVLLFSLFWNLPYLEGHTVNAEHFFVPLGLAGLLLALKKTQHPSRDLLVAGVLFGLGFLFKFHSFFDLAALTVFWLLFREPTLSLSYLVSTIKNLRLIGFGFVLPLSLSLVYFFIRGALPRYFEAAFTSNFDYAIRWYPELPPLLATLGAETMKGRFIILLILLALFFLLRKRFTPSTRFISLWLLFSLFGSLLSGRGYPHYLLTSVPALTLLLGLLLFGHWRERILSIVFLSLIAGSVLVFHFYFYPSVSYYANFISYTRGGGNWNTYAQNNFGWTVGRNYRIADYIKRSTGPRDRVFIFSDQPHLYALTDRVPAVPYLFIFQMKDLSREAEVMNKLRENPPRMVVTFQEDPRTLPDFDNFLTSNYQPVTTINDAVIYTFRSP